MSFDRDRFEERAAIMEYDGGMGRFKAETMAAKEQGMERWQVIGDVARRIVEKARDSGQAVAERPSEDNMPRVQPHQKKES